MHRVFLAFVCIAVAVTSVAQAQWTTHASPWTPTSLPLMWFDVDVQAVAVVDVDNPPRQVLFVGSYADGRAALNRTSDDGNSWQSLEPPSAVSNRPVFWAGTLPKPTGYPSRRGSLYITQSRGTLDGLANDTCDLWKSDDLGQSWSLVSMQIDACVIAIDPSNTQRMYGLAVGYTANFGPAVYRSNDGGVTWTNIGRNGLPPIKRLRVGADGTVYAAYDTVYVSHDGGDTWIGAAGLRQQIGNSYDVIGSPVADLLSVRHPVFRDNFVVAATFNGLFTSTDAGATWNPAGLQGSVTHRLDAIEPEPGAEPDIQVGYRTGIALLRGSTLLPLTNGLPIIDAIMQPLGTRYALTPAGLSVCASVNGCIGGTLPQTTTTLIEYHNSILDHYFMTIDGPEAAGIDLGAAGPGWVRTGVTYEVGRDIAGASLDVRPVCRFYGTPGVGPNSHFFSADGFECISVRNDPGWQLETDSAFAAAPGNSRCSFDRRVLLYRLYNNRFAENDSNHRYVSDPAIYQSMQAQGWKGEGIRLCVVR